MDKIKKLSTAIRIGSTQGAQIYNAWIATHENKIDSCAIGAVAVGLGKGYDVKVVFKRFAAELSINVKHPTNTTINNLLNIIIDLNDNCYWERERIADWLESIGY